MDADEFIPSVSNTEVLTAEESLSLILLIKGSTPKKELAFSSVERSGAWTEEFFKGISVMHEQDYYGYYGYGYGYDPSLQQGMNVPFGVRCGLNKTICIKSVLLINDTSHEFVTVSISGVEGKISKLQNRTYLGCELYEVVFKPGVMIQSNTTASITVQKQFSDQEPHSHQFPMLQGQQTIESYPAAHVVSGKAKPRDFTSHKNTNKTTITMQNVTWNFVVGFKFKIM